MEYVIKRNGEVEEFDLFKIEDAVRKAAEGTPEENCLLLQEIAEDVFDSLEDVDYELNVDVIHKEIEHALMDAGLYDTAREYITYRERNRPDIFRKRTELRPYEYPQLAQYKDAIRASYWTHKEFNYDGDVQDMLVNMSEGDVGVAKRAMLAIAQIEVAVKAFWGQVGSHIPKPEVADVGATFAESEVRHSDAYAHLLELMGLQEEFKTLKDVPVMQDRIKYLDEVNRKKDSDDPKDYFEAIVLFTILVEYISLFSQFYILMSLNKDQNVLNGISNAIEATSKEEEIHARFGFELIDIIKEENPDWWTEDLKSDIESMLLECLLSESSIIMWITGDYGDKFYEAEDFLCSRINKVMDRLDVGERLPLNNSSKFEWFNLEMSTTKSPDFFHKRSVAYNKRTKPISSEDLF